jgi:hemolysin activation/secretion protein
MIFRWDSWEIDVREQGTLNWEQGTLNWELLTGNREQGTLNWGQGTGNRGQGTGDREQGTGKRFWATLLFVTYVGFFPFTYLFTFTKVVKVQGVTAEILS